MESLGFDIQPLKAIDVFEGCLNWAKGKSKNTSDGAELRVTLGQSLHRIRFASFSVKQLVGVMQKYAGLITAEEGIAIITAITTQANNSFRLSFQRYSANL